MLGGARAFAFVQFNLPARAVAYACGFVQFVHRHTAVLGINQLQGYGVGAGRWVMATRISGWQLTVEMYVELVSFLFLCLASGANHGVHRLRRSVRNA